MARRRRFDYELFRTPSVEELLRAFLACLVVSMVRTLIKHIKCVVWFSFEVVRVGGGMAWAPINPPCQVDWLNGSVCVCVSLRVERRENCRRKSDNDTPSEPVTVVQLRH